MLSEEGSWDTFWPCRILSKGVISSGPTACLLPTHRTLNPILRIPKSHTPSQRVPWEAYTQSEMHFESGTHLVPPGSNGWESSLPPTTIPSVAPHLHRSMATLEPLPLVTFPLEDEARDENGTPSLPTSLPCPPSDSTNLISCRA